MKRFLKIFMWVIIAAIFVGTFIYLYNNSKSDPVVYQIVKPSVNTIEKQTILTGTIEPRDEIALKPQISGIISEILIEAGNMVSVGDVIAKIQIVPEEQQLSSAKSQITTAEIALSDARRRHERNTALYEKKVISREEFETTEVELSRAEANLKSANDYYAIVKDGVSPDNATQSNTLVRATASGLVLDVPVKVGASVIQANTFNDGTTIATIADMSKLIFKGTVDETEVGNLKVGQPMEVSIGALPDVKLDAFIEYISPKSAASTGASTFEIKGPITVPTDIMIRAGYSANAAVIFNRAQDVLTVPEAVVEFSGDSTFVYVLTHDDVPQVFERRSFEPGLSDGVNLEVKSGITADDSLRGSPVQ